MDATGYLAVMILVMVATADAEGRLRAHEMKTHKKIEAPGGEFSETEIACGYMSEEDFDEFERMTQYCGQALGVTLNGTALNKIILQEKANQDNPAYYDSHSHNSTAEYEQFFRDIGLPREKYGVFSICLFDETIKVLEKLMTYYSEVGDVTFKRSKESYIQASKACKDEIDPDTCLYNACVDGITVRPGAVFEK